MSLSRVRAATFAAILCLSLGSLAPGARAATVTYTGNTVLSPYLGASPYTFPAVNLPKFDIAGSCLSSVCVRFEAQTIGFASVENYENFPKVVNITWSAQFDLLRPSLLPLLGVTPTQLFSDPLTTFDGNVDYAGTSGITHSNLSASQADSLCLTSAADLALFSGAGTISLPITAANISTHTGANSWSFGVQGAGITRITYTYAECPTPARPATWGQLKSVYR